MSAVTMAAHLSEICGVLESASCVLILSHARPDADTLGSAFALRELLIGLGKRCEAVCADDIPRRLRFIWGEHLRIGADGTPSLRPETLPDGFIPDKIVSVDVSAPGMLGAAEEEFTPKTDLAIDHHERGTPFAELTYVAPVGACGEIITDLIRLFEERTGRSLMTRSAASALWAAICSDTGSFKFESVTAETYRRTASLLEAGINHSEIARRLFESRPISQVMATKTALNDLHFYNGNRIAVINFTQKMLTDNGLTKEDIDDIVTLTRTIEGVELGMAIKQSEENPARFKVSMRSARVADVSKICACFGGGGHKRASGCTVEAEDERSAEAMLMEEINREFALLDAANAFDGADAL